MRKLTKAAAYHVGMVAACVVIGFVLLVAVYLFPSEWYAQQAYESADYLIKRNEGSYPWVTNSALSQLENTTDTMMLAQACYADGNPIEDAVIINSYMYGNDYRQYESFTTLWDQEAEIDESQIIIQTYPRYWHGYLVLLKPLMLVFHFGQIRAINAFAICAEMSAVLFLMIRRKKAHLCGIPLFLTALAMVPEALVKSMHYGLITHLTLLAMIVVLCQKKDRSVLWYSLLFCMIGILTAYVDFLTFPTLALTMPLCTVLVMQQHRDWEKSMRIVIVCCAAWLFGYAAMWCGKWVIGTLVCGIDFFRNEVLESLAVRASSANGSKQYSRFTVVKERVGNCFESPVVSAFFFILAAALVCVLLLQCVKDRKWYMIHVLPFLTVLAVPFVWGFVLCNHLAIHTGFTYRIFACIHYIIPVALAYAAPEKAWLPDADTAALKQ